MPIGLILFITFVISILMVEYGFYLNREDVSDK